ncbi:hypothetical protein D9613_009677 [Agrocybe pediades]|uniref:F-box domain-containing protein n=1 Tax=Agrocybe pediades TaxID=84607 RepID=A0A8H4VSN1_9AGAR|nr:hypothetical protein D9613_009677 [Agrocybe pediades]
MPAIPQTHHYHIPSDVLFHIFSILAHPGPGPGGDCPPPTTTFQSDPLHPLELLRTISQVCAAWRAEGTSPVLWGRVVDLGYLWGGDTTARDEELDDDEGESITRRRRNLKERLREEVIKRTEGTAGLWIFGSVTPDGPGEISAREEDNRGRWMMWLEREWRRVERLNLSFQSTGYNYERDVAEGSWGFWKNLIRRRDAMRLKTFRVVGLGLTSPSGSSATPSRSFVSSSSPSGRRLVHANLFADCAPRLKEFNGLDLVDICAFPYNTASWLSGLVVLNVRAPPKASSRRSFLGVLRRMQNLEVLFVDKALEAETWKELTSWEHEQEERGAEWLVPVRLPRLRELWITVSEVREIVFLLKNILPGAGGADRDVGATTTANGVVGRSQCKYMVLCKGGGGPRGTSPTLTGNFLASQNGQGRDEGAQGDVVEVITNVCVRTVRSFGSSALVHVMASGTSTSVVTSPSSTTGPSATNLSISATAGDSSSDPKVGMYLSLWMHRLFIGLCRDGISMHHWDTVTFSSSSSSSFESAGSSGGITLKKPEEWDLNIKTLVGVHGDGLGNPREFGLRVVKSLRESEVDYGGVVGVLSLDLDGSHFKLDRESNKGEWDGRAELAAFMQRFEGVHTLIVPLGSESTMRTLCALLSSARTEASGEDSRRYAGSFSRTAPGTLFPGLRVVQVRPYPASSPDIRDRFRDSLVDFLRRWRRYNLYEAIQPHSLSQHEPRGRELVLDLTMLGESETLDFEMRGLEEIEGLKVVWI